MEDAIDDKLRSETLPLRRWKTVQFGIQVVAFIASLPEISFEGQLRAITKQISSIGFFRILCIIRKKSLHYCTFCQIIMHCFIGYSLQVDVYFSS